MAGVFGTFMLSCRQDSANYFRFLEVVMQASLGHWRPHTVITDFGSGERAAIDTFRLRFSTPTDPIRHLGCQFHFQQSVRRTATSVRTTPDVRCF